MRPGSQHENLRIIVGVDGSATSLYALEWATRLAASTGGHILAINAFVPMQSEKRPGLLERLMAEQSDRLATWCTGILESVDHEMVVVEGDARDVLIDVADAQGADLVVVSTVGASGSTPGSWSFGSVVEHLARFSTIPLAVIPPSEDLAAPPSSIQRVVLAVDGSEHSLAAARWLAELTQRHAEPLAVTAVTVDSGGLLSPATEQTWIDAGLRVLDPVWIGPLSGTNAVIEPRVVEGLTPDEGIRFAVGHADAHAIVMGRRGAGGFSGLQIGSVALKVMRATLVPVILVPPEPDSDLMSSD
jgi:nucleotide-binding universal stress UspA family protein